MPNEVEVPDVRGTTLAAAESRLIGQPLARGRLHAGETGQRVGVVVGQIAAQRDALGLRQGDARVPRALHGVVPRSSGSRSPARGRSSRGWDARCELTGARSGRVVVAEPARGRGGGARDAVVLRQAGAANGRLR